MHDWPQHYDRIFGRLERIHQTSPGRWSASCPAHEDRHPSLSLALADNGNLLIRCHRNNGNGCSVGEILSALDCTLADLFPDAGARPRRGPALGEPIIHPYRDERGKLLFEVLRYRRPDGSKDIRQRQPNLTGTGAPYLWHMNGVRRVLYRLDELVQVPRSDPQDPLSEDNLVVVVEGEKPADALRDIGIHATTNPGGAGRWHLCDWDVLRGKHIAVLPDNDPYDPILRDWVGQKHAEDVCRSLYPFCPSVRYVDLPGLPLKGDAWDWLQGLSEILLADKRRLFLDLVRGTPTWVPPEQPHPLGARAENLARRWHFVSPRAWLHDLSQHAEAVEEAFREDSGKEDAVAELAAILLSGAETFLDMRRRERSLPGETAE